MRKLSLAHLILGRPLASDEEGQQRLGTASGIPVFGLDALSSAAYGPEAALTVLIPIGTAGAFYILPITAAICVLLAIVFLSYRQTIAAYPLGGGSYTVARENLGERAGLLAAAALMIDYLLNVAVGISAGTGAIISAIPRLQPHTLALCLIILVILTIVNLRGISEPGMLFIWPAILFVGTLFTMIGLGLWAVFSSGGHPHPMAAPPRQMSAAMHAAGAWLILRAFGSGCTAMTGIEAVSNGVAAFHEPAVPTAQRTLGVIIAILAVLLGGIAYLSHAYGIVATPPGTAAYQSILSQLLGAVAGKGIFYRISIASIVVILCLSANTSFADFPRVCRAVAEDRFLPVAFANRGRRLVHTEGICVLAVLSALLLVIFGGVTDRLIPLFAVGAFMAFTLSQAGMVAHWSRKGQAGDRYRMAINGFGAVATLLTALIVVAAKFAEGAWIVVILVPALIAIMLMVNRHYRRIEQQTEAEAFEQDGSRSPLVVVPVDRWNRITRRALRFAVSISDEIQALHIRYEAHTPALQEDWKKFVEEPARRANRPVPKLEVIDSPYRFVIKPVVDRIIELEEEHPDRMIAVLLPELVERRWLDYLLHNQRPEMLALRLMRTGKQRIIIVKVPWQMPD